MLKRLHTFLSAAQGSQLRYCFYAYLIALVPSMFFVFSVYYSAIALGLDLNSLFRPFSGLSWSFVFGALVLAPLLETFLLSLNLTIFKFFSPNLYLNAAFSALMWGLLHGTLGRLSFFGSFWSFFIMSCCYLYWRPLSYRHGFVAAALPHFYINLTLVIFVWVCDLVGVN